MPKIKVLQIIKVIIFIVAAFCPFRITKAYVSPNIPDAYKLPQSSHVSDTKKFINEKEVNKGKYLAMCSYVEINNDSYRHTEGRINIYYTYNKKWLVSWDKNIDIDSGEILSKTGGFYKVFSSDGKNIFISDSDKKSLLEKGTCPKKAYIDKGGGFEEELCFGSEKYCKKRGGNLGTNFVYSNIESKKNYDINDQIKIYFDNYDFKISSCSDFNISNINIKEKMETDFINNFMNSKSQKNIPEFIVNSDSYKKGFKKIENTYSKWKEKCTKEITDNQNLTQEEKDKQINNINNTYNEVINQIGNVDNAIEEKIESETESIKVDSIDCNGIFTGDFGEYLKFILSVIRFAVPILILGLSIVDFIKAMVAQDANQVKKATSTLVQRLIIGVIIFLLPTLLDVLLGLAGIDNGTCSVR